MNSRACRRLRVDLPAVAEWEVPASVELYTGVPWYNMTMPDTKRGRERKGRTKRHQRHRFEIQRTLEAKDRDRDFEELYEDAEIELDI